MKEKREKLGDEAVELFSMKLELSNVLKRAEDCSYPNVADVYATCTSVETDLACVLGELNSLGYRTSFPVEGSSHTTASSPPAVVTPPPAAVTPPPAAVTPPPAAVTPPAVVTPPPAAVTPPPAAVSPPPAGVTPPPAGVTPPPAAVTPPPAAMTPPPAAVTTPPAGVIPPPGAVSPTISCESVEVEVGMVDADAVHKEARGKKRRISPKTLKSKSPDIRPFKKHRKND